jgi:tetratricopeptide (TPR) repeat protein
MMTWLRKLLGLNAAADRAGRPRCAEAQPPPPPARVAIKHYDGRIVSARSIDFTGQFAESPNKRFTLLWQDRASINETLRGGRYILLDDGRVILDRRMPRPQDGKVADNGVFILNDWGASDVLAGTFHAFAADGSEILRRAFDANLLNNGLSEDGALAVCQTCNAPGSPDSSVLSVFDLSEGREIACWQPESGWADEYEFPGDGRVRMVRRSGIPVEYSLTGEFLDRQSWYADEVARGVYYVIRDALKMGQPVTGLDLNALRDGAKVAISNPDERWKAESLRLLGEVEEQAGDERAALQAYQQALTINPKIGIAKRAAAISKRLGN